MEKEYWLSMNDLTPIYVKTWFNSNRRPKAIIQLSHGMTEHINRYQDFATVLVENGFDVYGNDHRGHGKTGDRHGLMGFFSEQDGFSKTTDDLHVITRHIKQAHPDIPIYILGHSMGSFLVRHYIQMHSRDVDGVILLGTGYTPKLLVSIAKTISKRLPAKDASSFMNQLVFGNFNNRIFRHKTPFDWLSRDNHAVQKYIDDMYCGFIPTGRFFYDLMTGLEYIQSNAANQTIRPDLPIMIMSGDADPVGQHGAGIWKTARIFQGVGVQHVKVQIYHGARHELLHETNKKQVYKDILEWVNENVQTIMLDDNIG